MKRNNISNFGYVIKFEDQTNLSILLENQEFLNDIIIDSDDDIYCDLGDYEICIVGVIVTDDNDNIVSANDLDDDNISDMVYTVIPLYIYKIKTQGLKLEDFVDLDIINLLFHNILDSYIKDRN